MRLMKHQQTLVALALGVALALPGFAETYTSASYVQREHLIAQWDGIDNAGLALDSAAFDKAHPKECVTLIACGADSSAALQTLADSLNAKLGRVRATVEDGTRLVYTAPPPPGAIVIVR